MSIVDKGCPYRCVCHLAKCLCLFKHFIDDARLNFPAPFYLDDHQRTSCLNKQIYLDASAASAGLADKRRCRQDERIVEAEVGEEVGYVRQDEVLELESKQSVPSRKLFKRREAEKPVFYRGLSRLDCMEVEPCIVVAYSVAFKAKRLSGLGVQSALAYGEPRQAQVFQRL